MEYRKYNFQYFSLSPESNARTTAAAATTTTKTKTEGRFQYSNGADVNGAELIFTFLPYFLFLF
jgi:hypothetical protein